MKNRILAMAALAAALLASCNKETEMINPAPEARPDGASVTITLSAGDDALARAFFDATATAEAFLNLRTLGILVLGVIAFALGTAGGVLLAKFMNLFAKEGNKINPLIGSAGVSAVPMAARVSQIEGQRENPGNYLLMHAMGPNVAGVVGSAVAAGILLSFLG